MSGSVFFEGNAFIDGGQIQNVLVTSCTIGNCIIGTSTLDMNMKNITSVKDPINPQDAATKKYVDDIASSIQNITLIGTTPSEISSAQKGSFIISIINNISNGPTGIFHVTKNESSNYAHIVRTVATPGQSSKITLMVTWPQNSGIMLNKNGLLYDGSYSVKIL